MSSPSYRLKIEVYDDEVGEVIAFQDVPLAEVDDDNLPALYRALRLFKKSQEAHEADHYPKESEYEEQE